MIIDSPIISGSLILTGSAAFTGSLTLSGSMNTIGTITATTLVVQTITSSISSITGSTQFGSLSSNTHIFTGSMYVTGALYVASGSVGIGTTTPSQKLEVWGTILSSTLSPSNTVGAGPSIYLAANSGSSYTYLQQGVDRFIIFGFTGGSWYERLTINNVNGNVGIGTTNPSTRLTISKPIDYAAYGSGSQALDFKVYFPGYDVDTVKASIYVGVSSIGSLNTQNGYMAFMTSDAGTLTERIRIEKNGIVLINSTSVINTNTAMLQAISANGTSVAGSLVVPNGASGGVCLNTQSVTSAGTGWYHIVCQSGNGSIINTNNMLVYGNGNIVNANGSYGTLSDISLKENITDATPKLSNLLQLKVRNFNLIADENKTKQIGFIAQELEEVFPSMVEIDGNTNLKSIKTSVLVPMLVKAIQELNTKLDAANAEIEALKAK